MAPFKSKEQRRYLWKKHPDIARRWTKKHGAKVRSGKRSKYAEALKA